MYKALLLIALTSCLIAPPVWSQTPQIGYFGPIKTVIKLDPLSNIPEGEFPFDRYFYIRRYIHDGTRPIMAVYITEPIHFLKSYSKKIGAPVQSAEEISFWLLDSDTVQKGFAQMVDILVPSLKPRKFYDLAFDYAMSFERREQLADALIAYYNGDLIAAKKTVNDINAEKQKIKDPNQIRFQDFETYYRNNARTILAAAGIPPAGPISASLRSTLIESLNDGGEPMPTGSGNADLLFVDTEMLYLTGTRAFKLETRAEAVIQPDFGAVFYGFGAPGNGIGLTKDFMGVMPYVGFNIMLRSFDADIPIRFIRPLYPWQRLSFHAGVTLLTLAKDNYRDNLFGGQNLMLGVGYRLNSGLKLQGGLILYKKRTNPSPLNTDNVTAPIGYLGLSLDLRLRKALGDVGKFFTAN